MRPSEVPEIALATRDDVVFGLPPIDEFAQSKNTFSGIKKGFAHIRSPTLISVPKLFQSNGLAFSWVAQFGSEIAPNQMSQSVIVFVGGNENVNLTSVLGSIIGWTHIFHCYGRQLGP
jgi:hypothetical protein